MKSSNGSETRYYVFGEAGSALGEYDETGKAIQELIWLGGIPVAVSGELPRPCAAGEEGEFIPRGSDGAGKRAFASQEGQVVGRDGAEFLESFQWTGSQPFNGSSVEPGAFYSTM